MLISLYLPISLSLSLSLSLHLSLFLSVSLFFSVFLSLNESRWTNLLDWIVSYLLLGNLGLWFYFIDVEIKSRIILIYREPSFCSSALCVSITCCMKLLFPAALSNLLLPVPQSSCGD